MKSRSIGNRLVIGVLSVLIFAAGVFLLFSNRPYETLLIPGVVLVSVSATAALGTGIALNAKSLTVWIAGGCVFGLCAFAILAIPVVRT